MKTLHDSYPPLIKSYYNEVIIGSSYWSSIVFHCGDKTNARLICSKFQMTNLIACKDSFTKFTIENQLINSNTAKSVNDNHTLDYNSAVIVSVVLSLVGGMFIGFYLSYLITYQKNNAPGYDRVHFGL